MQDAVFAMDVDPLEENTASVIDSVSSACKWVHFKIEIVLLSKGL